MRARRMITARRAVTGTALACSAVLIAALLGVPSQAHPGPASAAGGATPPTAASLAAERLLRSAASAPVTVTRDAQGLAHAVGTTAGHPVARPAGVAPTGSDERLARVHLAPLGALFGLADPAAALRVVPADAALAGAPGADRIVRFQQVRDGVPVLGGELVVVLDAHGALRSITGETLPSPAGAARAPVTVTAAQARATAMAAVRRAHPEVVPAALRASAPERWYLDPELIGAPATLHLPTGPVWRTEVTDRGSVRRMVLVDARTGSVPLNLGLIHSAVPRVICDRINREDTSEAGSDCVKPYARASARTSGTGQVDTAFDYTADAEEFYARVLGGDLSNLIGSDAGDGKKLRSTVRYCPPGLCETVNGTVLFDNAFWNGRGMFYGDGWEQADDIVAHELTHGVVEKTARLLYFYQSGAINESFSDIFGELVDLSNGVDGPNLQGDWRIGEDAPGDYGPTRNMASPTSAFFAQPDRMTSGIYDSDVLFQDNGGVHGNSGVGNKAAFLIADGGSFNGQSIAGIGRNPAAKLFYRTLRMLTSGSDYADFGVALNQACADLKLGGL